MLSRREIHCFPRSRPAPADPYVWRDRFLPDDNRRITLSRMLPDPQQTRAIRPNIVLRDVSACLRYRNYIVFSFDYRNCGENRTNSPRTWKKYTFPYSTLVIKPIFLLFQIGFQTGFVRVREIHSPLSVSIRRFLELKRGRVIYRATRCYYHPFGFTTGFWVSIG